MRIIQITPGSGDSFYCENCIRDAAVVTALRKNGHDTTMVPLYLPPAVDGAEEPHPSDTPIFFGGVNVYLQQKMRLFRWTPRFLDRLLDAPSLLRWAASKAGMTSARDLAATTLSMLRGEDGRQRKELNRLVAWLARNDRPDIVSLSNALLVGLARRIKKTLRAGLVFWLQDEDEFIDALPAPQRDQAWAIIAERCADVDQFIASSRHYADKMIQRLRLPADRVHVVYDAMDWGKYLRSRGLPGALMAKGILGTPSQESLARIMSAPRTIGYLSRMCRDKGLDILVDALAMLKAKPRFADLKLRAAGGQTGADRVFLDEVRNKVTAAHLDGDVEFLPNLLNQDRRDFLAGLTVMCVPERTGEAAGLYVLESLASGVPVVQPSNGAFPELIEATGGGVLFEPGNAASLAAAMEKVLGDATLYERLASAGRKSVVEDFSIAKMVQKLTAVYELAAREHIVKKP